MPYFDGPPAGPVAGSSDPIGDLADGAVPSTGSRVSLARGAGPDLDHRLDEGTNARREQSLQLPLLHSTTTTTGWCPPCAPPRSRTRTSSATTVLQPAPCTTTGAMANRALIDTAELLGDIELHDLAVQRLLAEIPYLFSPMGFTYEQSSDYLVNNIALWAEVQRSSSRATPWPTRTHAPRWRPRSPQLGGGCRRVCVDPTGHTPAISDGKNPRLGPRPAPQDPILLAARRHQRRLGRPMVLDERRHVVVGHAPRSEHAHARPPRQHRVVDLGLPVLIDPGSYSHDAADPDRHLGGPRPPPTTSPCPAA